MFDKVKFNINEGIENSERAEKPSFAGLIIVIVVGILAIFGPIITILSMNGKFLLGRLFKKVQDIDAFKKFRKTYTIFCLAWWGISFFVFVLLCVLLTNLISDFNIVVIYIYIILMIIWIINIAIMLLSIDFGDKIYTEHKGDEVDNLHHGSFWFAVLFPIMLISPVIIILGMYGKLWLLGFFKQFLQMDDFKKYRRNYTIICVSFYSVLITASVLLFNLVDNIEIRNACVVYAILILLCGNVILLITALKNRLKFGKQLRDELDNK